MINKNIIDNKIDYLIKNGNYSKLKDYIQHNNYSTYDHCVAVAKESIKIAKTYKIKVNYDELVTAALLHDYYLYDWHEADESHRFHGFSHGKKAMINAIKDYHIGKREQQAIKRHMFPLSLPPTNKLGIIITIADKICAVKEMFVKKLVLDNYSS